MAVTDLAAALAEANLSSPMLPENRGDPYRIYRFIREREPVHHAPDGSWVLTRYDPSAAPLPDPRPSPHPPTPPPRPARRRPGAAWSARAAAAAPPCAAAPGSAPTPPGSPPGPTSRP